MHHQHCNINLSLAESTQASKQFLILMVVDVTGYFL